MCHLFFFFFFQAEDGIRDYKVTGVQTCALPISADVWCPDETLAGSDGYVRPEFVWAALDCAGGIALANAAPSGRPHVLGRLSAGQLAPVKAGQPHVVAGWRLAQDGRKLTAGSALFTAAGQVTAAARATWI